MIDYNTPPELNIGQVALILTHMQPEDVKRFNEYCMIHFPEWLYKIMQKEAAADKISIQDFVQMACVNEVIDRINKRNEEK